MALKKCKNAGCFEPVDCIHGYCFRHCPSGHRKSSYDTRRRPKTSEPHIGVEVEVEFSCERDMHRAVAWGDANGRRGTVSGDGSLSDWSAEFKLLAPQAKIIPRVKVLLRELFDRKAIVNRRCGLHVHIDAREVKYDRIMDSLQWLQDTQAHWFALFPPSRRNNRYVQWLDESNKEAHYTWAHLSPYRTIEVRIHGGTLNPFKMEGWLAAMIHLGNWMRAEDRPFPLVNKTPADNSYVAFLDFWKHAPGVAKEYIEARRRCGGVMRDMGFQPREEVAEDDV